MDGERGEREREREGGREGGETSKEVWVTANSEAQALVTQ